ncbi:hypothetical protein D9M72_625740 [compost metagenome]
MPQRADSALEHRGIGHVKAQAGILEQLAGLARLVGAGLGQVDVDPAGKAVFKVPRGFAVADEDELVHAAASRE